MSDLIILASSTCSTVTSHCHGEKPPLLPSTYLFDSSIRTRHLQNRWSMPCGKQLYQLEYGALCAVYHALSPTDSTHFQLLSSALSPPTPTFSSIVLFVCNIFRFICPILHFILGSPNLLNEFLRI